MKSRTPVVHQQILSFYEHEDNSDFKQRGHYFFSNDTNFFDALISVPSLAVDEQEQQANRLIFVVGDSYLLSALPWLVKLSGANTIYVCDNDKILLKHILYYRQVLMEVVSENEFLDKIACLENPIINKQQHIERYLKSYAAEKKRLGPYHCFYNHENMVKCQTAHQNVKLVPVCINLFDAEQVKKLAKNLPGQIALFNLTNLREWDPTDALSDTLSLLPVMNKPIILSSSCRKKFNYGSKKPQTRALICCLADYHQTYQEIILFETFIRRGNDDRNICKEILSGKNHINTPDSYGYTPIEIAVFYFICPRLVRLLFKYGAIGTTRLVVNMEENIKHYYAHVLKESIDLSSCQKEILEIKEMIVTAGFNVARFFSKGELIFSTVIEHAVIVTKGPTRIKNLAKHASVIVSEGDLVVERAEGDTHLQTMAGHVVVQSFAGKHLRIISSGDVIIATDATGMIDIISQGIIKVKNIGEHSFLLAKAGIQGGNIDRESLLLSAGGNIQVNQTEYGVRLATTNADILINFDPPHAGTCSIKGKGQVRYHLQGLQVCGPLVTYNMAEDAVDCSPLTHCYYHTGEFYKQKGVYQSERYHQLITNFAYKWTTGQRIWPMFPPEESKNKVSFKELYTLILHILGFTPAGFLSHNEKISVSSGSVTPLSPSAHVGSDHLFFKKIHKVASSGSRNTALATSNINMVEFKK